MILTLGTEFVHFLLLEQDREVTLIDAGLSGYRDTLEPALAEMGRSIDDVNAIVLTHADTPTTSDSPASCNRRTGSPSTSTEQTANAPGRARPSKPKDRRWPCSRCSSTPTAAARWSRGHLRAFVEPGALQRPDSITGLGFVELAARCSKSARVGAGLGSTRSHGGHPVRLVMGRQRRRPAERPVRHRTLPRSPFGRARCSHGSPSPGSRRGWGRARAGSRD
jgi:Metallo-beta-lactamase superfamily